MNCQSEFLAEHCRGSPMRHLPYIKEQWILNINASCQKSGVILTKILPGLLIVLMIMHIIKPIGLPGLRRRADFWKIAFVALAAMAVVMLWQMPGKA